MTVQQRFVVLISFRKPQIRQPYSIMELACKVPVINMAESARSLANMILILKSTSSAKFGGKNIEVLSSGLVYIHSDSCKAWHVATEDTIILKSVLHLQSKLMENARRRDLVLSRLKSVDRKRFCYVRRAVKRLRGTRICSPQPAVPSPRRDTRPSGSCWERASAEKLSTGATPPPGPPPRPPLAGPPPPGFHLEATQARSGQQNAVKKM